MKFRLDNFSRITLKIDNYLLEGKQRDDLERLIFNPNNWEINNYKNFVDSVDKTPQKLKGFLSYHPVEELAQPEWKTFKLKNADAGFALHYTGKGKVDICNVHNNSDLKGIGNLMISFAKTQGGSTLDNYAGFLSDLYQKNGFDKYETWDWDDEYRPQDWCEEEFGTPNVELRTRTSHDKRYNNSVGYRNHFDKKMDKAFPGNNVKEALVRQIVSETIKRLLR